MNEDLKTCEHLHPLEQFLREKNFSVIGQFKNWTEETGFSGTSIYFNCLLDVNDQRICGLMLKEVEYRQYGIAGQYSGFFCARCHSVLSGYHPDYKKNLERTKNRKEGPFF